MKGKTWIVILIVIVVIIAAVIIVRRRTKRSVTFGGDSGCKVGRNKNDAINAIVEEVKHPNSMSMPGSLTYNTLTDVDALRMLSEPELCDLYTYLMRQRMGTCDSVCVSDKMKIQNRVQSFR